MAQSLGRGFVCDVNRQHTALQEKPLYLTPTCPMRHRHSNLALAGTAMRKPKRGCLSYLVYGELGEHERDTGSSRRRTRAGLSKPTCSTLLNVADAKKLVAYEKALTQRMAAKPSAPEARIDAAAP